MRCLCTHLSLSVQKRQPVFSFFGSHRRRLTIFRRDVEFDIVVSASIRQNSLFGIYHRDQCQTKKQRNVLSLHGESPSNLLSSTLYFRPDVLSIFTALTPPAWRPGRLRFAGLRRWWHVGMAFQKFADGAAEDAGSVAVDDADAGQAGEEGAVEVLFQLLRRLRPRCGR